LAVIDDHLRNMLQLNFQVIFVHQCVAWGG